MKQTKYNWQYDDQMQQFQLPTGKTLTLHHIAQRIQDDAYCRHDLQGDWSGWQIRGQYLKGPGGIRITPATGRQFVRWINHRIETVA